MAVKASSKDREGRKSREGEGVEQRLGRPPKGVAQWPRRPRAKTGRLRGKTGKASSKDWAGRKGVEEAEKIPGRRRGRTGKACRAKTDEHAKTGKVSSNDREGPGEILGRRRAMTGKATGKDREGVKQ